MKVGTNFESTPVHEPGPVTFHPHLPKGGGDIRSVYDYTTRSLPGTSETPSVIYLFGPRDLLTRLVPRGVGGLVGYRNPHPL